jgi:hypothetical protein
MDASTGGILGATGIAISLLGAILSIINHKRVRSGCCGKKIEVSLDVENTTPPGPQGGPLGPQGGPLGPIQTSHQIPEENAQS